MKQNSITARAIETGISTKTLHNWKASGCNVLNDSELRERIKRTRHLPLNLKPDWMPRTPSVSNQEIRPLLRLTACLDELVDIGMDQSITEEERLAVVVFRIKQLAEYIDVKGL